MPFYYNNANTSLYEKIACYFNYLTPRLSFAQNANISISIYRKQEFLKYLLTKASY